MDRITGQENPESEQLLGSLVEQYQDLGEDYEAAINAKDGSESGIQAKRNELLRQIREIDPAFGKNEQWTVH